MLIVVVGAGGHGQVVADCLLRAQERDSSLEIVGFVDDDTRLWNSRCLGLPVLGPIRLLAEIRHNSIVVAIGDNQTRARLFEKLIARGERAMVARHPHTTLSPDVTVGTGTMICAGVVVNPGSTIGVDAILNTAASIDHHNHIGNHVHIAPGVHLGGNVVVEDGALVGIGATVAPGCRIGARTIVGAGAVVIHDLPEEVVAVGVPATAMKRITGEPL